MTTREKAIKLHEAWEADNKGYQHFADYALSEHNTFDAGDDVDVADKALEMLWDGVL